MAEFRLTEQKYAETEYLFKTIDMAKSDEEYEAELCTPPPGIQDCGELLCFEPKLQSNKTIEKRNRYCAHRRFTLSNDSPPAPPTTPTSLTNCPSPMSSPTTKTVHSPNELDRLQNSHGSDMQAASTLSSRYLKKITEHHRTDAELAQLFKIVTLTAKNSFCSEFKRNNSSERGISATSRTIRKPNVSTKIFKVHRNPKEFFREPDDEDSVSAPEYDAQEECRLARYKHSKRYLYNRRQRRFARFQHQEKMEAILDIFDATMNINDV